MRLSEISQIRTNIVCADGFRISYQASEGHYCEPKVNEWNDKFSLIQNEDRDGQEIELMEIEGEGKGEEWQMKDPRCTVEYNVVEVTMSILKNIWSHIFVLVVNVPVVIRGI